MNPRPRRLSVAAITAALFVGLSIPAAAQAFRVAPVLPVPAGPHYESAAVGDFNGDGRADVVVSYDASPTDGLALFTQNSAGGFDPPVLSSGRGRWNQSSVADLNGDGRADLVSVSATIGVSLADATGHFTTATLSGGGALEGVAVADVNNDGHLDIVGAHHDDYSDAQVMVWLGNGSGHYTIPTTDFLPPTHENHIALGDLSGDGFPDVALAVEVPPGIAIATNDHSGRFAYTTLLPLSVRPVGLALADLNGDGRLDVASSDLGANLLTVYLASAAGGFGAPVSYPGPGTTTGGGSVLARDLDGDARPDLAVSSTGVWLYKGTGGGGFAPPVRFALTGPHGVGDVNGDGRVDVVAGHAVLLNQGAFVFDAQQQFPSGSQPRSVATADLNGDGKLDLVTANRASNDVAVLLGAGDGTFAAPRVAPAGLEPYALVLGDFNGDARVDVAVANRGSSTVSILAGDGAGGLAPIASVPVDSLPRAIGAADLNGDGPMDLFVASEGSSTLQVLIGSGGGSFFPGNSYVLARPPSAVAAGALNPDFRPDLVFGLSGTGNGGQGTLIGIGNGAFQEPVYIDGGGMFEALVVADLSGDGKADFASSSTFGTVLDVMLGDGFGGFTRQSIPSLGDLASGGGALALSDFTRDGHPDLAVGSKGVALAIGDGSGRFGIFGQAFDIGGITTSMARGDFDGDGHDDLAAAIPAGNAVTVLLERPAPPGADLSVSVVAAPTPAVPHAPLVHTITVANAGPLAATNVVLTFVIPETGFLSSVPGAPVCVNEFVPLVGDVVTCTLGGLAVGAQSVVTVTADVNADAGDFIVHAKVVAAPPLDPAPVDNDILLATPIGLPVDMSVTLADSADPVAPGASFAYTMVVGNQGSGTAQPGQAVHATLALPNEVTALSASLPNCGVSPHSVQCFFSSFPPLTEVPVTVNVQAGTFTSVVARATVSALADVQAANDTDTEETRGVVPVDRELLHGSEMRESFAPGGADRLYYFVQQPYASYEVMVDAVGGRAAASAQPIGLERLAVDLSPAQSSAPVGTGRSRTLRFENAAASGEVSAIRVTSTGCSTACSAGDVYRIRAWETTGRVARFSNTDSQRTVLILQNPRDAAVNGHAWLWDDAGVLRGNVPFTLGARENTRIETVALAPGRKGSITVTHDAGYGGLAGKAVSLDSVTGFAFDTPMLVRPR